MLKRKTVLPVILVLALLLSTISYGSSFNLEGKSNDLLPDAKILSEKKHVSELLEMKRVAKSERDLEVTEKKFDQYMKSLSKKDLLSTIAETSSVVEDKGDYSELSGFTGYFLESGLLNDLNEQDFITVINQDYYSDFFKMFMMETWSYKNNEKKLYNSEKYNSALFDILKDDTEKEGIRLYAMVNIDSLNPDTVEWLSNEAKSTKNPLLKINALNKIAQRDIHSVEPILTDIIENYKNYSNYEVKAACELMADKGSDKQKTQYIGNIITSSEDKDLVESAVMSLGYIKTEESVQIVANNIKKIDNESIVRYFVDMNFTTVSKMLTSSNIEERTAALQLVEAAPFMEFTDVIKNKEFEKQPAADSRVDALMNLIQRSDMSHNAKWDQQGGNNE